MYSQVLLACVQLRVLEILQEGPESAAGIAERVSLSPDAALRLLRAAVSLGLLEHRGGDRFGLAALGAVLASNRGITAMIEHHPLLYADLSDPVALLRGERERTELARYWAYATATAPGALGDGAVAPYSALMSASQSLIADQVLDACPLDRHRCLLDVGGGDGTFLLAAAARAPGLRLLLFDLPAVAARARARFEAAGLDGRATAVGGDAFSDPLPEGADVISLVRVVHDHDDERALALLRAARRALPEDGLLLLAEPMSGTPGAAPIGDAYFGFYLLAMGAGRTRTAEELGAMLRAAGFDDVRSVPTAMPLQTRILLARPSREAAPS